MSLSGFSLFTKVAWAGVGDENEQRHLDPAVDMGGAPSHT